MEAETTPFEALKAAVNRVGSQSAMARLLGVGQPTVWKWLQSGKRLPAEHVITVERETGVPRHLLRPDIYPSDPSSSFSLCDAGVATGGPIVTCDRATPLQKRAGA